MVKEGNTSPRLFNHLDKILQMPIKIKLKLWYLLLLQFVLYLVWETYWYNKIGLSFIKWHTHIAVLLVLWFLLALVFRLFSRLRHSQMVLASVFVSLLIAETLLMITGYTKTYMENRQGDYQAIKWKKPDEVYLCWAPNATHYLLPHNIRHTNKYGFSDAPFKSDSTKILIQTYGDSFTEGDGAPADSSYPAILRNYLRDKYLVQNYGVCGNDPGYVIPQFKKVGANFNPQIIIILYSVNDFNSDFLVRGGLKRFSDIANPSLLKPKWYEPIYAVSYISRLVFNAIGLEYNRYFLTEKEYLETLKKLEPEWNEIFEEIARLAKEKNTKVLLVKRPDAFEIKQEKYMYNMAFFDSFLVKHKEIYHTDLLPFYQREMQVNKGGNIDSYFLVGDGHHNPKGYSLLAKGVHSALIETGLVFPEK